MTAVSGIYGEYTLPANGFTAPSGKQFKAWSVGGAEKTVGATINVTANTTVTAIWENIPVTYYTITFDSAGGSVVVVQAVKAGQKVTKPADPVKNGYIFKGWTLDGSVYNFNATVNTNITLVAVWKEDNSFMDDLYWALIILHSQRFDITATASEGGEIAPAGVTKVQYSKISPTPLLPMSVTLSSPLSWTVMTWAQSANTPSRTSQKSTRFALSLRKSTPTPTLRLTIGSMRMSSMLPLWV